MIKIKLNKYFFFLAVSIVASLLCIEGDVIAAETFKIGIISAQTGPGAAWGLAVLHGVELAVADAGGEFKVGKENYKIEIIAYDGKYTGKDAVAGLNRLLFRDNVRFIIGPISSASALAMKEIVVNQKVLQLCNSFTDKLLDPNTKNIFRVLCTPIEYSPYFAKWIRGWFDKNFPGKEKTYAFLAPNDETGWVGTKYESEALQAQGFNIIFKEFYERGTKDFVPLLTKMMSRNPTALDCDSSSPGDAGLIVKQARQMGFKGPVTYSGGPGFEEVIRVAGEHAEGLIGWSPQNLDDPKIRELAERHLKKYGQPMNLLMPNFYMATHLLITALQQAGTVTEVDKVIKTIENIDYSGIFGRIKWVGKEAYGINHQILYNMYVGRIMEGGVKMIDVLKVD